jgi:3-dehydroquinate dehydratase-2
MKVLVVNGPNLDLLGTREQEIYGTKTLSQLEDGLETYCRKKLTGVTLEFGRSNREGEIIELLNSSHKKFDALIINPGALAYQSYALRDSVAAFPGPRVIVHISNIFAREPFRRNDLIAEVADGLVCGLGVEGYRLALDAVVAKLTSKP